ncbi:MFS transporter [Xylanimonas protaetiae]|uniref:MFS transporter n=1 Tax=Xylanimonas protaetiae TaxID=2509457 RepID=A0A4P6EZK0_9MICO|nr:MFS transporter [Xylanimonas protaetiae]QAY68880.1 MFS transporter [Xylanimonas protaetiae]
MPDATNPPLFPFRTVVLGAFVPAFLFDVGVGALLPVIAPTATDLGSSLAVAGVVAALLPIGTIAADLPAGALAAKVGDRVAMVIAGVVGAVAFALAALAASLVVLAGAVLVLGAAEAVFNLARHSYLTEITPPLKRARVMSTLGGVHRIGQFVGPFAGALVIDRVGLHGAYWLAAVAAVAATVTVVLVRDDIPTPVPARAVVASAVVASSGGTSSGGDAPRATLGSVLRDHRALFTTLGVACLLIGAVRGARQTVIPLWGEHLGLDPAVASVIFGVAGGVDMLLFYPAGKVMDRMGRNWIAIPSMLLMGVALVLLPFTGGATSLAVVGMALGFGNGIGSGILMTLGSDASPAHGRAQFLGLWRVLQDTGSAVGPLVVSAGAALGSLAAGIWATAALAPTAAAALARWVPRWTVHANRTTRRAAGIVS